MPHQSALVNPPHPLSLVTIAVGFEAGAGVVVAVERDFQSRSSPVRELNRPAKLLALNRPKGLSARNHRSAQNGPSTRNTARLPVISRSFYLASRSPNISGWRRPGPPPGAKRLQLRLRKKISQFLRSRRFFPKTSPCSQNLRDSPSAGRHSGNPQSMPLPPIGIANSSACTR